jgi:hypothetical protein
MVGPLKKTTAGFTHLLVAIDKFSKWIQAQPVTNIRSEQATLFFIDSILQVTCLTSAVGLVKV